MKWGGSPFIILCEMHLYLARTRKISQLHHNVQEDIAILGVL